MAFDNVGSVRKTWQECRWQHIDKQFAFVFLRQNFMDKEAEYASRAQKTNILNRSKWIVKLVFPSTGKSCESWRDLNGICLKKWFGIIENPCYEDCACWRQLFCFSPDRRQWNRQTTLLIKLLPGKLTICQMSAAVMNLCPAKITWEQWGVNSHHHL